MKRRVYIFVRGILGWPGDSREWNAKAIPYVFTNTPDYADNFETMVGPVDRVFGQWRRARNLARTINEFQRNEDVNIVIVGHSNGTDVALKALRLAHWPRIEALHLVSSACQADFWANGLNQALVGRRIGRVCLYRAGKDMALRLAHTLPGKLLGYGTLGLSGPLNVYRSVKDSVGEIVRPDFGHSTWFSKANFARSMAHFTQPVRHVDNWGITPSGNRIKT